MLSKPLQDLKNLQQQPILVIEDCPLSRKLLLHEATNLKLNVTLSSTIKEGWQLLTQTTYTYIILDNYFEDDCLQGVEVARDIKSKWPESIIILATASDYLQHVQIDGIDYIKFKPFLLRDLLTLY